MNRYKIETDSIVVNSGYYSELVRSKHIVKYGDKSAFNIWERMKNTYAELIKQYNNPLLNNNSLFVGKIQSGKTSNLEMLTALALDNGFNMIVIFGGYDTELLKQTKNRFRKTFDADEWDTINPKILCTDNKDEIRDVDEELIDDIYDDGKPIIIISLSSSTNITLVNEVFKRISTSKLKTLIIDDEGDQASQNIASDKENEKSATYASIVEMKEILDNPLYISVTATPQANIFLDAVSELKPDSIHLVPPGESYCGADVFHLEDNNIVRTFNNDIELIEDKKMPQSLKNALLYFAIASVVMKDRGNNYGDMIIHTHWQKEDHSLIYSMVKIYIDSLKGMFDEQDQRVLLEDSFRNVYDKYLDDSIKKDYSFDYVFDQVGPILKKIRLILQNGDGKFTRQNLEEKKYKVYIGGNLLQRGLSFDYLTTTYFTRWPNSPKMDTNFQRARWLGYRSKYIDLCKVFTLKEIANEYSSLADIENDLWIQFSEVENGKLDIDNITIDSTNTNQEPTSKSKVNFTQYKYIEPWRKQRLCLMDKKQISDNKNVIDNVLENYKFDEIYNGRRKKDAATGKMTWIGADDFKKILLETSGIFQNNNFDTKNIISLLSEIDKVPFIKVGMDKDHTRTRTLQEGTNYIKVLHQGADEPDEEKINYEGDQKVLYDNKIMNVQMFEIIPKRDNDILNNYKQYFFAIYIPGSYHSFYKKG